MVLPLSFSRVDRFFFVCAHLLFKLSLCRRRRRRYFVQSPIVLSVYGLIRVLEFVHCSSVCYFICVCVFQTLIKIFFLCSLNFNFCIFFYAMSSAPIENFFASTKNLKTFEANQEKSQTVQILDSVEDVQLELDSVLEDDLINTIGSLSDLTVWLQNRLIWKPIYFLLLIQQIGGWVKSGNTSLLPLVTAMKQVHNAQYSLSSLGHLGISGTSALRRIMRELKLEAHLTTLLEFENSPAICFADCLADFIFEKQWFTIFTPYQVSQGVYTELYNYFMQLAKEPCLQVSTATTSTSSTIAHTPTQAAVVQQSVESDDELNYSLGESFTNTTQSTGTTSQPHQHHTLLLINFQHKNS